MPNENDTEATREDALNTYESLFGDTSADQTVTVANEEADKNETEQAQQDSEIGEDQTGGDETAPRPAQRCLKALHLDQNRRPATSYHRPILSSDS